MDKAQRTRAPHTRTERHTRTVEHQRNGRTYYVEVEDERTVPDPPTDWDLAGLRFVVVIATLMTAGSLGVTVWSVGGLLSHAVHPGIAYPAAAGYDLLWVACMVLEWLERHDDDRAREARNAGWVALLLAMAAVGAHGWLVGSVWIGAASAVVSLAAKWLWGRVRKAAVLPVDPIIQQCVRQDLAEVGAQIAVVPGLRRAARVQARYLASMDALGLTPEPNTANTNTEPAPARADGTVRSAVQSARDLMPDATDADIAAHLIGLGIDATPDDVRAVPNTTNSRSAKVVRLNPNGEPSIAEIVRTCVRDGVRELDDVLAAVRGVHPNTTRDVVRVTLTRAVRAAG